MPPMKHWETVADRLSAAGWSWGYSPLPEMAGGWIVDAHGHGKRYIVHSDEPLSAFLELEAIVL